MKPKLITLATLLVAILTLDIVTKRWALSTLGGGNGMDLFGGWVPLTLAFNRGAAFGIEFGSDPRLFFVPVTVVALVLLTVLLYHAERATGCASSRCLW